MITPYLQRKKKITKKNEEYVWENLQISLNKNKFIILCLLFFGLIILYNYVLYNKDNSDMIQSYENKENVYFISKFNNTKAPKTYWNYLDKFYSIYGLYQLCDNYLNITYRIKEFFQTNITTDIFDLNNYIKIKEYLGLDGNITKVIENGVLVLTFIIGPEILNFRFEKQFFIDLLLRNKLKLGLGIGQFLLLSGLLYFGHDLSISPENIIDYAKQFFYQIINLNDDNDEINNSTLILK